MDRKDTYIILVDGAGGKLGDWKGVYHDLDLFASLVEARAGNSINWNTVLFVFISMTVPNVA